MRVRFEFFNEVLERDEVETMYAELVDEVNGYYKLDNIPFFVKGFAADDIVKAEKVDDGLPLVTALIEKSGNSTVNIMFLEEDNDAYRTAILQKLKDLGVEYEGMENVIDGYYTLHVPKDKDYHAVIDFLNGELEQLEFREACNGNDV